MGEPTSDQEGKAGPERTTGRLEQSPARRVVSKDRAYREAHATDQVPEANVPAEDAEGGDVPFPLCFDHEERAGDDEAHAADHLRGPVDCDETRR